MTYAYFALVDNADSKPAAYLVTSADSAFFELHGSLGESLALRDVSPEPEKLRLALHHMANRESQSSSHIEVWQRLKNYRENVLCILNSHRYSAQTWHLYDPFAGVKDLNFP